MKKRAGASHHTAALVKLIDGMKSFTVSGDYPALFFGI